MISPMERRHLPRLFCFLVTAGFLATSIAAPARAQRLSVEALFDGEMWKTDAGSILLAKNAGRPAPQGRVHGWLAYDVAPNLKLSSVVEVEGGYAEEERAEFNVEMLELRYTPHRFLGIRVGKILSPMGTFGARHFSNVNPLVGDPDLYPPQYPWGAVVVGAVGPFDYRAGAVSLPAVNPRYSPEPSHRLRPVGGAGVSLGPSLHLGVSLTQGPYLGSALATLVPDGSSWQDYGQTVQAADLRYSKGYFDTHAEAAWSSYEVPGMVERVRGFGWYDEMRVTLSPRVFAALRYEHFRYAFIGVFPPKYWVGAVTVERNVEVGVGYRMTEDALLKVSYRRDFWPGEVGPGAPPMPDGSAVAVQMSYDLDVSELLRRRRDRQPMR